MQVVRYAWIDMFHATVVLIEIHLLFLESSLIATITINEWMKTFIVHKYPLGSVQVTERTSQVAINIHNVQASANSMFCGHIV